MKYHARVTKIYNNHISRWKWNLSRKAAHAAARARVLAARRDICIDRLITARFPEKPGARIDYPIELVDEIDELELSQEEEDANVRNIDTFLKYGSLPGPSRAACLPGPSRAAGKRPRSHPPPTAMGPRRSSRVTLESDSESDED